MKEKVGIVDTLEERQPYITRKQEKGETIPPCLRQQFPGRSHQPAGVCLFRSKGCLKPSNLMPFT